MINCTLRRSPERSHTEGLVNLSTGIMRRQRVGVEVLRAVDHDIATGVRPNTAGTPTTKPTTEEMCDG